MSTAPLSCVCRPPLSSPRSDWNDALDTLHEEEYSREEVVQELQQLRNVVKGAVRSEHQTMVNMVVLLLKQVFEEAQEQGAALEMDMHAIEDAK